MAWEPGPQARSRITAPFSRPRRSSMKSHSLRTTLGSTLSMVRVKSSPKSSSHQGFWRLRSGSMVTGPEADADADTDAAGAAGAAADAAGAATGGGGAPAAGGGGGGE